MNNDYKKLAEFISFVNEQMAQTPEEKIALLNTLDRVGESFRKKIETILSSWEKDIEDGKITDETIIHRIKGLREEYNSKFADNKE